MVVPSFLLMKNPMGQSVNCEICKVLKTQHEKGDRISNLPDHVLMHIISLLPIWSAVATSVLSKRWKNVWTGINTLYLTDVADRLKSHEDHSSFRNFLEKVLLCKEVGCLQLVKFYLSGEIDRMHASVWISLLMKRGIRKLELDNKVTEENEKLMLFSPSFSTSHTLVELILLGNIFVSFPVSLRFPSVKVVSMEEILLDGTSVRNLLSGCPALEDLSIDDCNGGGDIDVHSYSLKKLSIGPLYLSNANDVITINAPNLHDLVVDVTCSCVINAPNVRDLFVSALCSLGRNFQMNYMPSLVKAYLNFDGNKRRVLETLRSVRSVRSLTLGDISILEDNVQELPMFSNLTFLDVTMSSWPIILHLLELSPNLEYFVARFENTNALEWSRPPRVPDCILDLEGFRLVGFDGDTFMMELIIYIFWNANFLEEMIIDVCGDRQHLIEPMKQDLAKIEDSSDCYIRVVCTSPMTEL